MFSGQPWGRRAKRGAPRARPCCWGPPVVADSGPWRGLFGPLARLRPQPSPARRWPPTEFQPRGCSGM
eukprot:629944-Alexandrium_andersonii.AAC.1